MRAGADEGASERRTAGTRHAARIVLLGILALCTAALWSRGGAAEWLLFGIASAVTGWCWLVPYASVGNVSAERAILPGETPIDGGQLRIRLTVRMSRPLPLLWLSIRDELAYSGRKALVFRSLGVPWFGRTHTVEYSVSGLHRGEMTLEAVQVSVGDLLGLTVRSFHLPCLTKVLVRPRPPFDVREDGSCAAAVPRGGRTNVPARGAAGAPAMFSGLLALTPGAGPDSRVYAPGDPLRRIDWRAMARGIGLQTRIDDPEPPGDVYVLLDVSEQSYGGDRRLFDAAVGHAAFALKAAFDQGMGAVLQCGGGDRLKRHIRAGDRAALVQEIDFLSRLAMLSGRPFDGAAAEAMLRLPWRAAFIGITAEPPLNGPAAAISGASPGAGRVSTAADSYAAGPSPASPAGARSGAEGDGAAFGDAFVRAARFAARQGLRAELRISSAQADAGANAARWKDRMKGTGCTVAVLPVPESYRRDPVIGEGRDVHDDGAFTASKGSKAAQTG